MSIVLYSNKLTQIKKNIKKKKKEKQQLSVWMKEK